MTSSTGIDRKRRLLAFGALAACVMLSACASKPIKHGHVLLDEEIEQVQPGMGKDQVQLLLGSPDTTSTMNGETYYYISSTAEGPIFLKPKIVDRRIVAVYFDQGGAVTKVAHYGLKDGKVFDFISRTTPSHTGEQNILMQLLGNLGMKKGF